MKIPMANPWGLFITAMIKRGTPVSRSITLKSDLIYAKIKSWANTYYEITQTGL